MNAYEQMREALEYIVSLLRSDTFVVLNPPAVEIIAKILLASEAALALPLRNCDIGTAEEQLDRYGVYCQNRCTFCDNRHYCNICGERYRMKCMMEWAQMPYEAEGGAGK